MPEGQPGRLAGQSRASWLLFPTQKVPSDSQKLGFCSSFSIDSLHTHGQDPLHVEIAEFTHFPMLARVVQTVPVRYFQVVISPGLVLCDAKSLGQRT